MLDNLPPQSGPGWSIHHSDCIERMNAMPPDSVDSICTDPPYHLTSVQARYKHTSTDRDGTNETRARNRSDAMARLAGGFMGKTWDGGDVAFRVETWRAAWRVLKPGGYIFAFASSRGYHRMACAIEDAGFITHPMIGWCFGCLDDRTECVTRDGVQPYHKLTVGQDVLSYDAAAGSYQWDKIEEIVTYEIDDTAYRIATDHGEQVVSRDHRCIIEQDGNEIFEYSHKLPTEVHVPVLESLSDLLNRLSMQGFETETTGDMLGSVQTAFAYDDPQTASAREENDDVLQCMSGADLAKPKAFGAGQSSGVFVPMQRQNPSDRTGQTQSQGACGLDGNVTGSIPGEDDRREQSGMERRGHVPQSQGQLCVGEIRTVSACVHTDVETRRLRDGTSSDSCSSDGTFADQNGSSSPSGPQPAQQSVGKSDAVCDESRSQVIRAWPGHKIVVGRVTPFHYRGLIWCIRVRTGAFVAVRDGMAFPTGNSGFPKASNAARMIDQALGVKGGNEPGGNTVCSNRDEDGNCLGHPDRRGTAFGLTYHSNGTYVPTSPEAAEWNGWYYGGQARKPALEPIYVGQKPFSEKNGALNILKWGVGAVNIDGCRVPLGDDKPFSYPNGRGGEGWHGRDSLSSNLDVPLGGNPLGRWPANLIHDGSPEVIALFPDSNGSGSARRLNRGKRDGDDWGMSDAPGDLQDAGTGTAARFFNCYPPAIPPLIYSPKASSADRLGSKHPTVKPQKLMRDIIKHGTPPGGIVLDPFCGTGSTLAAARSEGRQSIGIEADPTSVVDTVWRMTCDTR